ncbi:MAG: DUF433 domain-containing protein [Candidatus Omnitrophota bacterium]|jgi:uncharacterized protein (DUF433 family)|nr:MAG: DUF433 domain-containing protein [Candidatus Omnitrophota bacterium]
MTVLIQTESPPLRQDESGALRIGDSRVLLELVVRAFVDGATPEAIVQRYPTTSLADIYAVISYYLRHREDIELYLAEREMRADEIRRKIEDGQKNLETIRRRVCTQRIL